MYFKSNPHTPESYFIQRDVIVLDGLSKVDNIHFHKIVIEGMDWYEIICIGRDLQKRELITNIDCIYRITEAGQEYLKLHKDLLPVV